MTFEDAQNVKDLLNRYSRYKEFLRILNNYDSKLQIVVSSFHNDNRSYKAECSIDTPSELKDDIVSYVKQSMNEILMKISEF